MRRTASVYGPDETVEGVSPMDISDKCIEDRHIGDSEILPSKMATIENSVGVPFVIYKNITTGSATAMIFNATAPFKLEIIDVIIQARGASTNGTMKVTNGTNDITNTITCAVNNVVNRAGTLDSTKTTIAKGGTIEVVCAGDSIPATIGLVTIVAVKVD